MGFKGITVNTAASADAHIFAEDDAAIYQAIFGGDGVMNIGNKFAARVLSNNKVRVSDGVLCVGGHIGRMQYADYTDLTIENGVSGKNRNDIIYAKFVTSGDVDSYVLDVRKGTAGSTAADPAMTQGNLYQGATLREYPLWRVKIEGLSIVKIEQLFSVIPTIPELQEEMKSGLSEVNGKLNWFDIKNVYGEYTAVGSNNSAEICRLSLTPGTWLLLGYIDNSMSKDTIYNNSIFRESLSHHCQTVRSTLIGGGGSVNSYAITVQTNMDMLLGTYDNSDIKGNIFRGTLLAIRLLKL